MLFRSRVFIKGLMMMKRHKKPSQKDSSGSIVEKEASIHISNVMPIDPKTDKPTRVRYSGTAATGKVRLAKSGREIEVEVRAPSRVRD